MMAASFWKSLATLASPAGKGGRLSVLFFHRVHAKVDPLAPDEPTADRFDLMLSWLRSTLNLLPLDEAVARLADGTLPPAAGAITFDDGYRDNLEIAAPLLLKHHVPATFFITTGFSDGGAMWNDIVIEGIRKCRADRLELPDLGLPVLPLVDWEQRRTAIGKILGGIKRLEPEARRRAVEQVAASCGTAPPEGLMMSVNELRRLAGLGFGIGAHTVSHPILARLPDAHARDEIVAGRNWLESRLDRRIGLFAYPNGRWADDFDHRHVQMVADAGFDAAFSTERGVGQQGNDHFNLPRFTPWDRKSLKFRLRLLQNMRTRAEGTKLQARIAPDGT